MKVTHKTLRIINKHGNTKKKDLFCEQIYRIARVLTTANALFERSGRFTINDGRYEEIQPLIFDDGREFYAGYAYGDYEKHILSGLSSRYPDYIRCSFTHGLNEVFIYDANKLIDLVVQQFGLDAL